MQFSDVDLNAMRELGIAVYRGKIILDAQAPITDGDLARISGLLEGEIPGDLLELWQTSFGGELDYDYEVAFDDHLYSASLKEIFYIGSNHYHSLTGWIETELEGIQDFAEENGDPVPEKLSVIPFAGFEYLERFYVSLAPDDYGKIIIWAMGLPPAWKGRLTQDSVAMVAESVSDLFDHLTLDVDPFADGVNEYASGRDMAARIEEIEESNPELAQKLRYLVKASVFDWKKVIEESDFEVNFTSAQLKAARLALKSAVEHNDPALVEDLSKSGVPFDITVSGESGILPYAMTNRSFVVIEKLLDLNLDLGESPIIYASECSDGLLRRLVGCGVRFDEEAMFSAAEYGAIEGAVELAKSKQLLESQTIDATREKALERAKNKEEDASAVESGKLGSYLTAEEYREQAESLRRFGEALCND